MFPEHSTTRDYVWLQGMKNSDRLKSRNARNMGKHCMAPPVGLRTIGTERDLLNITSMISQQQHSSQQQGCQQTLLLMYVVSLVIWPKIAEPMLGSRRAEEALVTRKILIKVMLDRLQSSPIRTNMMPTGYSGYCKGK